MTPGRIVGLFAALAFAAAACDRVPDVGHPIAYEKGDVSFQLPGNWKVKADVSKEKSELARYIIIEGAALGSIAVVQLYRSPPELTLEEFAADFRARSLERAGSYGQVGSFHPLQPESGAIGATRARVGGALVDGVEYKFSMTVLQQKVPHTGRVFRVDGGAHEVAYLILQTPDAAWPDERPGFELFADSFALKSP